MNLRSALGVVQSYYPKVKTLVDAKGDLMVQVTGDDEVFGNPKSLDDCAVARACRHMKGFEGALVGRATAYIVQGEHATRYRFSPAHRERIVRYDREWRMEPGNFLLKAPCPSSRLGRDYGDPDRPRTPTGKHKRKLSRATDLRIFRRAR